MGPKDLTSRSPAIFVVERDAAVLAALEFALELEGFAVRTYRSAGALLAEKTFPDFGCLIVDFNLGDMDGLDLVAALRERAIRLPAILTTGRAAAGLRNRAEAAGARIVEKPFLGNGLVNAIRESLGTAV